MPPVICSHFRYSKPLNNAFRYPTSWTLYSGSANITNPTYAWLPNTAVAGNYDSTSFGSQSNTNNANGIGRITFASGIELNGATLYIKWSNSGTLMNSTLDISFDGGSSWAHSLSPGSWSRIIPDGTDTGSIIIKTWSERYKYLEPDTGELVTDSNTAQIYDCYIR